MVQKGGIRSAAFDTLNRVLYLPVWDVSESVYDMLVAHEVSHALHSPQNDRRVSIPRYNITEDARIERLILSRYPGYARVFKEAYSEIPTALPQFAKLLEKIDDLKTIDRLNLAWKLRKTDHLNAVEYDFFCRGLKTESFEECVALADEIVAYTPPEPEIEMPPQDSSGEEEAEGQSGDEEPESEPEPTDETEEDDGVTTEGDSDESGDGEEGSGDKDDDEEAEGDKPEGSSDETEEDGDGESGDGESGDKDEESESESDADASSDDIAAGEGAEDVDDAEAENSESESDESASDAGADEDGPSADDATEEAERQENADDLGAESQELFDSFAEDNVDLSTFSTPVTLEEDVIRHVIKNKPIKNPHNSVESMSNSIKSWNRKASRALKRRESKFDATKSVTRNFVKEFKRRKNAHELLRTQRHRTGKINTKKLYAYRTSDDIFLSRNIVEGATNHGLTMFVDFSGSMRDRLDNALAMVYSLSEFAKQCDIKFQVFGFLSSYGYTDPMPNELMGEGIYNIRTAGTQIFKICDTSQKLKTIRLNLHQAALAHLGGTPLDGTLIASRIIHGDFLKKHNIEKSMIVFLTDGGNGEAVYGNLTYSDGLTIKLPSRGGEAKTRMIGNAVEASFGGNCKIINIFMTRNVRWDKDQASFERNHVVADSTFSRSRLNVKHCNDLNSIEQATLNHAHDAKAVNKIITEIIKEFA